MTNQAVNDFEKEFYKLLHNAFCGKTRENVRSMCEKEFIKRDDNDRIKNNKFNKFLIVFKSPIQTMIVTLSNKMKF